ncbi:unnamed protein product [Durusdinium trenchii]|uniref:Uncharacterized protein n=1 Tax=Durusdinium trenchii TaxID=1381693 RepID=A0ABP0PH10_9DINO
MPSCQSPATQRQAFTCVTSSLNFCPAAMTGTNVRPTTLEFLGLAGNFGHLNMKDPFDVKKRGSTYFTEFRAGLTTFLAMAYILPVNSGMLSLVIPGMREQLVCATALAAFCGCWLMGTLSNYPFMLGPGSMNAFFTFTICLGRGLPYQAAFASVFVAGCMFLLVSITGLRTLMIRLFPKGIKETIGAGVGLFLTFIAFQASAGMGLSTADPATLVTLNSLSPESYDAPKLWLSLVVLGLTAALFAAKVPGAPLMGILFGTAVCWIEGFARGKERSVFGYPFGTLGKRDAGFHIYLPTGLLGDPSLSGLSGALWSGFGAATDPVMASTFWTAVATFCYTDLLDASGTFFAVAKVARLTDTRGNLPLARQNMAYLADGFAALIGAMLGVSTVVTFAESTVGVADGAKTGLAPLVTGTCFLLAIPIAPVVSAVPPLATGPILCLLGVLMCQSLRSIDWEDFQESIPAFVTMVTMPYTFSIGYGIIAGLLLWLVIQFLLIPVRLVKREDPLVRFKVLWAGVFVHEDEALAEKQDLSNSDTDDADVGSMGSLA